jgi:putative hemolysin
MGKSKVRGGAKAHRKRVQNRNTEIKNQQSMIQKLFNDSIKAQIEEMKDKLLQESGATENQQ